MKPSGTDLESVLTRVPLPVKEWIYNNPKIADNREFQEACPCADLIKDRRYCDVRGKLIDCLTTEEQARFKRRPTFGKHHRDTERLQSWIRNHRHYSYFGFKKMLEVNGNEDAKAFCARITKRKFKHTKKLMIQRGEITNIKDLSSGLFDDLNLF